MTQIHFHLPPELTELAATATIGPCLICVLYAKGDQLDATETQWKDLVNDGKQNVQKFIEWPKIKAVIKEALIVAPAEIPGLPPVPVCWDHMASARRAEPVQAAPPHLAGYSALPPGLNGKRGG